MKGVSDKIEVKRIISEVKFNEGGAAIFAALKRKKNKAKIGNKARIPLVKKSLRVDVVSYKELARANSAEEQKPWAIIIIKAPSHPQICIVIIPAVNRPICPTEE